MTWDITRWDNAAYIVAIVLGCGFSAVITLLLGGYVHSHRAWKDGYDDGYYDGYEKAAGSDEPLVDVCARLDDYLTPIDPPSANYPSY